MQQVETIEAAKELPEGQRQPLFETSVEVQPNGILIKRDKIRPLVPQGVSGNSILFFEDSDGRLMKVVYTEEGPVKVEVY